ncbi:Ig-like domain-containing protein [Geothrix terrae]|uniref:Ig-like domain-containing protein n=1 Tax=Geothrix terrae TaxID=2922720 RepID=UPI001FACD1B1|nr:Ig-like domain-containing protein [Geothrix terrae]
MLSRLNQALLGASLLTLLACSSGGDSKAPTIVTGTSYMPSTTTPVFDPANANVPLPNVLATATAADPLTGRAPNKPMTPPEALAYVNLHEMGGTNAVSGLNAPIYIQFNAAVDASTITPANIKVFQLTPDAAGTENNPLGFTDISGLFTYQYTAGGTDLFLFPNFPLLPGARYLYVVTNRVKDTAAKPISASPYFEALKSVTPLTGSFAALEPIRANVLSGSTILFSGYAKVMDDLIAASATTNFAQRSDIAVMGRFITTGAGAISATTTSPSASGAVLLPVESALRKFAAGATLGGLSGKTWSNAATIPANTLPGGPFYTFVKGGAPSPDNYWQAVLGSGAATAPATVGLVALGTFASGDLNVDPVLASANAATMNLTGTTGAYNPAAGVAQAFRDSSHVLTGFYHTDRTINFVYIAPDPALVTRPANGYPLVIYQHGITSQKETVIALAQTLTASGYALIAIDLPLHGQNAFPGHTTGTQWGNDFMAVGAPLATRTNMQQSVVNLTRLELVTKTGGLSTALAAAGFAAETPDITTSPSNIKFVGVSLGAITGAYYLASNTTLSASGAPYSQASLDNDMKGFLNCPGGRLAYLISNSPAFGPAVNAGLAAAGIPKGSPTYNAFFLLTQAIVDPVDPATLTTPLASGLPSRLSGRLTIQEATSSTFDAYGNTTSTDGDQVISNVYTRYFASALGGRAVLGTSAAAAVGPNFAQVGYLANGAFTVGGTSTAHAAGVVGTPFMFTLNPGPSPKVVSADASVLGTTPKEGYFQFDQTGVAHAFLLNPANPVAITLGQRQFAYWLGTGLVVDPTQQGATLPIAPGTPLPESMIFQAPSSVTILGH